MPIGLDPKKAVRAAPNEELDRKDKRVVINIDLPQRIGERPLCHVRRKPRPQPTRRRRRFVSRLLAIVIRRKKVSEDRGNDEQADDDPAGETGYAKFSDAFVHSRCLKPDTSVADIFLNADLANQADLRG